MQISLEIWPIKTRRVNYRNRPRSDPDARACKKGCENRYYKYTPYAQEGKGK